MKKQFFCLLFIFLVSTMSIFGWGGKTHQLITHYSWLKSKKLGDMTFLLQLNLDKGMLNERLSDGNALKNPDEWMQCGAEHEDDTSDVMGLIPDRSNFHFHNPLKYWWEAGLNDIFFGVSVIYWAQDKLDFYKYLTKGA